MQMPPNTMHPIMDEEEYQEFLRRAELAERPLNRQERRRLKALERKSAQL